LVGQQYGRKEKGQALAYPSIMFFGQQDSFAGEAAEITALGLILTLEAARGLHQTQ
jgi:hypothetical protein